MEQTQRIPEELRNRLRPHQARVGEILELGLAVFEELLPPPEELVAYSRQELDEEAREALAERLALDEEAVDELLDLERFEELEPPSEEHRLSDGDVKQALELLRWRISNAVENPPETETLEAVASDSRALRLEGLQAPRHRTTSPVASHSTRSRWMAAGLALAAGLLLGIGLGSWKTREASSVAVGHQIRITTSRANVATYSAPQDVAAIQLVLDAAPLPQERGRLRISTAGGEVVLNQEIRGGSGALLFVTIPSERLPAGAYRAELLPPNSAEPLTNPWSFVIVRTPPS